MAVLECKLHQDATSSEQPEHTAQRAELKLRGCGAQPVVGSSQGGKVDPGCLDSHPTFMSCESCHLGPAS